MVLIGYLSIVYVNLIELIDPEYHSKLNDNLYNFKQQINNIYPENENDENINEFSNLFLESYKQYDESSIQDDTYFNKIYFFTKKKDELFNKINKTKDTKQTNELSKEDLKNIHSHIKKAKGRKLKNSKEQGFHNKFTFDNIIRKIKAISMQSFFNFFNNKIKEVYKDSEVKSLWGLKKLNQSQIKNSNIEYNRLFFEKSLKDIFSDDITTKWKTEGRDHNKKLIEKLLNEENKGKKIIFEKILNYKFIDIVKYLRGEREGLDELKGLDFDEYMWNKIKKDENYLIIFKNNMKNIEKLIQNKKPRIKKKYKNKLA
jgi:hypothetical protein